MIDAVGDILFPSRHNHKTSVFGISSGKLDLNVKLVHQPTNISTLSPNYARVNTIIYANLFYDKILLNKTPFTSSKIFHNEMLSTHKLLQHKIPKSHNKLTLWEWPYGAWAENSSMLFMPCSTEYRHIHDSKEGSQHHSRDGKQSSNKTQEVTLW